MPKVRAFKASPGRGAFVQLTLVIDRHIYETLAADAQAEGVSVEQFTAEHLRKMCRCPRAMKKGASATPL